MAAPISPPETAEAPSIAGYEDEVLDAYIELEGRELAWLGYADEAVVQAELSMALDVTGSG